MRGTPPCPRDETLVADFVAEADAGKVLRRDLFNPVEHVFEGHTFFIPQHYDEYLTALYGDWKAPAPAGDRECTRAALTGCRSVGAVLGPTRREDGEPAWL